MLLYVSNQLTSTPVRAEHSQVSITTETWQWSLCAARALHSMNASCADLEVLCLLQCSGTDACAAHQQLGVYKQSAQVLPERAPSAWLQYSKH
jgi:hypothetical protein